MSKEEFEQYFEPPTRAGVIDLAEAGFICKQINQENTIKELENQIAVLERALELACIDANDFIVLGEGCWFGACNTENYENFTILEKTNDDKLMAKAHCDYFKSQAKQEIKKEKE